MKGGGTRCVPKGGRGEIGHIEMHREKQKSKMRKHGDSGDRDKMGGGERGKLLARQWSGNGGRQYPPSEREKCKFFLVSLRLQHLKISSEWGIYKNRDVG